MPELQGVKKCKGCRKVKPLGEYARFRIRERSYLRARCRSCSNSVKRENTLFLKHHRNLTAHCECGSEKEPSLATCLRCQWLDGECPSEAEVIALIRGRGGSVSWRTLSDGGGMADMTGPARQRYRAIQRLIARGRLKKRVNFHYDSRDVMDATIYTLIDDPPSMSEG